MIEEAGQTGGRSGLFGKGGLEKMTPGRMPLNGVVYALAFVLVVELVVRVALLWPGSSDHLRVDHERSWRQQWVERHRETGKEIYYEFDVYDATKGWISRPNLRNVRVFRDKILNTNSKGYRGNEEYAYRNIDGKTRIVVLGDSFTFGDDVSDDETYASYLQESLPQAEVINLGVHGYAHDQMLMILMEDGVKYDPDIVLIGFVHWDMSRNLLNFRDFAKPRFFRTEDGKLQRTGVPVPSPEQVLGDYEARLFRLRSFDVLFAIYRRLYERTERYEKEKAEITRALIDRIVQVARDAGATPVLAYLPVEDEITSDRRPTRGERFMMSLCRTDTEARCTSTRTDFAEEMTRGVRFKTQGHWRSTGHEVAARSIEKYLVEEGLLKSGKQVLRTPGIHRRTASGAD